MRALVWAAVLALSLGACVSRPEEPDPDAENPELDPLPPACPQCGPSCQGDEGCGDSLAPLCEQGRCSVCPQGTLDASLSLAPAKLDPVKPGAQVPVRLELTNKGSAPWSRACGLRLLRVSGEAFGVPEELLLPYDERIAPGGTWSVTLTLTAPATPGRYLAQWQMARAQETFGPTLEVALDVVACRVDADCASKDAPKCATDRCVQCKVAADCPQAGSSCEGNVCKEPLPNACGAGPKPTSFVWTVPSKKSVCQKFKNPIQYQTCGWHTGDDICGTNGAAILSAADGKVVHVGPMWLSGSGVGRGPYAIIVQHSKDFYSTYGHNRKALVKVGDCVRKGQTIAEMGSLGYSSGPHLHLEFVEGTKFTGNWQTPFANACSYYKDPLNYAKP